MVNIDVYTREILRIKGEMALWAHVLLFRGHPLICLSNRSAFYTTERRLNVYHGHHHIWERT
jgi:hypothetical protein